MKKLAFALCALVALCIPASAQDWPPKQVKIIAPFGPGSTPDIVARLVADELEKKFSGSVFIVENKPGGGGNIGTDFVAKADPDGATIGISIGGPLAINPILNSKLPYDPKKDIAPVTKLVSMPSALAVHPDLKVNSVAELVALLKKNPGKYNFGSIGTGSLSHLSLEALAIEADSKIVQIAYPSSPATMTALIRGDVQMVALPAISVKPHADAGKAKILAVTLPKRSPFLPDIPTLKESGIDVEADTWMGMIAPGGTPAPVVDKINKAVVEAIKQPKVKEKLATYFMEPVGNSPAEFRAVIDGEVKRWSPIIKAAGIKTQ